MEQDNTNMKACLLPNLADHDEMTGNDPEGLEIRLEDNTEDKGNDHSQDQDSTMENVVIFDICVIFFID